MKKRYSGLVVMAIGVITVCFGEAELITLPKNKKKYVSEQQCVELKSDMVVAANDANRSINELRASVDAAQKVALDGLCEYANGEKDCFLKQATKVERTNDHEKSMKILKELERCSEEIQKMQQRLDGLLALARI